MVRIIDHNCSCPVSAVEEELDDDVCSSRLARRGPKPLPAVDQLIVNFICSRFPERIRMARLLSSKPPPYGVAYRDVLRLRCIGGALADLGLCTGKPDSQVVNVQIHGDDVLIRADDVMVVLGMRPSTYRSVRSRLEKVQSVYTWLGQNKNVWQLVSPPHSLPTMEHRAYNAMLALFGPTPLPTRRLIPPEPHPAGVHDALWEPCATFVTWAEAVIKRYGLEKTINLPVSPDFYDEPM